MMLAQADIGQLPANFIKNIAILLVVVFVLTSFLFGTIFAGLQYFLSRRQSKRTMQTEIHPQPFEITKAPKRFNFDFENQRHKEIDNRLLNHENEISALRAEDKAIRGDMAEKFDVISLQLGKIIGQLESK
jgi:hypothetical protein